MVTRKDADFDWVLRPRTLATEGFGLSRRPIVHSCYDGGVSKAIDPVPFLGIRHRTILSEVPKQVIRRTGAEIRLGWGRRTVRAGDTRG